MDAPIPLAANRPRKYHWEDLDIKGWLFFPDDANVAYQGASIRNSATAAGQYVRIVRAEYEGRTGYMVTRKEG